MFDFPKPMTFRASQAWDRDAVSAAHTMWKEKTQFLFEAPLRQWQADEAKGGRDTLSRLKHLERVLLPLTPYLGHDWLGQVLGVIDPSQFSAVCEVVRRGYGKAQEAFWKKEEASGKTLGRFLEDRGAIIIEDVKPMSVTTSYAPQHASYVVFVTDVMEKISPDLLPIADRFLDVPNAASAPTLLLAAGYEVSDTNTSTLVWAVESIPGLRDSMKRLTEDRACAAPKEDCGCPTEGCPVPGTLSAPEPSAPESTAPEPSAATYADFSDEKEVLVFLLKTINAQDLAPMIGVSRSSVINMSQGKTRKPLSLEGAKTLAHHIGNHARLMASAAEFLQAYASR